MSGAIAQSKRLDIIANNLANADTAGFKSDDLAFEEALLDKNAPDYRADIPEQPPEDSQAQSKAGDERRVVLYGAEFTDLRAGAYRSTGNTLDVAIEGNGFLEVLTPNGVRLTRAGNLALDPQGRLVTPDGFLVLGPGQTAAARAAAAAQAAAQPAAATATLDPNAAAPAPTGVPAQPDADQAGRAITVGSPNVVIDAEGNIYPKNNQGGGPIGRLGIVQVENPAALKKEGRGFFVAGPEAFAKAAPATPNAADAGRNPAGAPTGVPAQTPAPKLNPLGSTAVAAKVHQGMLEGSNVNPISEMTEMIEAHRLFDQNTKLMQTHGDALSRASEIGRF